MSERSTIPNRVPVAPFGEPLVDAATVAAYLSVDTATIYRLAKNADLPAIEVAPRVLRFRPDDVRTFLDLRTRTSARSDRVTRLLGDRRG